MELQAFKELQACQQQELQGLKELQACKSQMRLPTRLVEQVCAHTCCRPDLDLQGACIDLSHSVLISKLPP